MSMAVEGLKVLRDTREVLHALEGETEVAIDLETSGLSPAKDKVAVISLYGDRTSAMGVLHVRGHVNKDLREFLEDPKRRFTYYNGVGFDIPFLLGAGVRADKPPLYDGIVGATLLDTQNRRDRSKSLRAEVERRLDVTLEKDSGGHGHWMDPELTEQQVRYCAEDIVTLHGLRRKQELEAAEKEMTSALELESSIIGAVAQMTHNGLPIDLERLDGYLRDQAIFERDMTAELGQHVGAINWGSHTQVKKAFMDSFGVELPTTNADILEQIAFDGPDGLIEGRIYYEPVTKRVLPTKFHRGLEVISPEEMALLSPEVIQTLNEGDYKRAELAIEVVEKMVALRKAKKAQNSYGPKFQAEHVHNLTVHSRFWQIGTGTGRFSSSDPNLQQVTKGMRYVFGGKPGYKIVSLDYSQIEVIVAAFLAKDQVLLDLIEHGPYDIHTMIASQLFKVDPSTIGREDKRRSLSKACSFTLFFGGGAQRLRDQARQFGALVSLEEAKDIANLFFNTFQAVRRERQAAYQMASSGRRAVSVRIVSGLRRDLVGENIKATTLLNTRVQGAAAAGLKNALRLAHLAGMSEFLGAQVHDELVAVVPSQWAEEYAQEMEKLMIKGMQRYIQAPISVGVYVGDYWK